MSSEERSKKVYLLCEIMDKKHQHTSEIGGDRLIHLWISEIEDCCDRVGM